MLDDIAVYMTSFLVGEKVGTNVSFGIFFAGMY